LANFPDFQRLKEVPRLQHSSITKALEWYEKTYESREEAMAQAYFSGNYTMKEISIKRVKLNSSKGHNEPAFRIVS
jgi:hypothetical protein